MINQPIAILLACYCKQIVDNSVIIVTWSDGNYLLTVSQQIPPHQQDRNKGFVVICSTNY